MRLQGEFARRITALSASPQGNNIMALTPQKLNAEVIGTGSYPRLAFLDMSVICIWESEGQILSKSLR